MTQQIYVGTHAKLKELLGRIPGILSGRLPDSSGMLRELQARLGMAAQARIRDDFVTKARKGTGTDGISWPDLTQKYKAYGRRVSDAEKKTLGITGGMRHRGLLTRDQDKVWRRTFYWNFKRLVAKRYSEKQAKEIAARIAWAKVKAMGAKTKLDVYGNRELKILRDEGIMLDLLSPAVGGAPVDPHGQNRQIFDVETAGVVRVGIEGPKAKHHLGDSARGLPQRALWPTDTVGRHSEEWWSPILRAAVGAVQEFARRLAR